MKYIIAIGIFQALAATILLWRSRIRNQADDLLIALLVSICLHLSIKFFIYSFVLDTEVLTMMNTFIWFCYLPLLYLYTLKTIQPSFIPASKWYVFVPLIIGAICFFSVVSALVTSTKAGHQILSWYNAISVWAILSFDAIMACWIIIYANKKLNTQSNERRLIIQLASLFLATSLLSFSFIVIKPFGFAHNYIGRSIIYSVLIVICIRIITFRYSAFMNVAIENFGLNSISQNNQDKFKQVGNVDQDLPLAIKNSPQENKLTLSSSSAIMINERKELLSMDEMLSIALKLENAMNIERYYSDSELTLDKLSSLTKHNKYHISETLNHFLHKPFYTFVNEYRIKYVKQQIENLSQKDIEINMLSLAYDAGFNSKSSFNRYFKEIVGQTPTAYLKMITHHLEIA
ncbi:helix-turn-helix domain-containing protein [Pedobacter frigoris]|nr:helix-turn-helix domain-containing protein [Pedobacter frigoris]